MEMVPILLAATLAGYIFLRNPQFLMDHLGQITCQIILIELTIETIQSTWCS
jgi:hypothetical protein